MLAGLRSGRSCSLFISSAGEDGSVIAGEGGRDLIGEGADVGIGTGSAVGKSDSLTEDARWGLREKFSTGLEGIMGSAGGALDGGGAGC
jgi:hypothetical protein